MIINFGSMASGVVALAMALGCYTVSLKVSGERKAVDDLRAAIARDQRGIRVLQAELATRARTPELQRWNDEVLALAAPTAGQFVRDPVQLASFAAPTAPVAAAAPKPDVSYALARVPTAPASPVVKAAYAPKPAAAPAPRVAPAVTANLDLDDSVVTTASLDRVAFR
ncbi:hypothetical protein [Glacieibacterium frigidum]|uniref:Uncharacterized protein n=1 Tax=Glacieibacterium frigidum TaxID=2593303 RepID=A0A552UG38_9SPHN|nr:hypothetical protein [Glacieibacterium frigidum]TRW17149.1 hypothetical protein FMM06_02810 [Glacieibacterium frigidum]